MHLNIILPHELLASADISHLCGMKSQYFMCLALRRLLHNSLLSLRLRRSTEHSTAGL